MAGERHRRLPNLPPSQSEAGHSLPIPQNRRGKPPMLVAGTIFPFDRLVSAIIPNSRFIKYVQSLEAL